MERSLHSKSVLIQFPIPKLSYVFGLNEVYLLMDSSCCFISFDRDGWLTDEDFSNSGENVEKWNNFSKLLHVNGLDVFPQTLQESFLTALLASVVAIFSTALKLKDLFKKLAYLF